MRCPMTGTAAPPRMLGVFAHPDDEVFCVGGTFARYCADGAVAKVVSTTRGEAGQIRDAAVATRRTLGQVREAELRRACALLGVHHVACLDHTDGTLADVGAEALADEVCQVILDFRPDVVFTFGDDGAYGHPDHVTISRATTLAVQRLDVEGMRLFHSHFPDSRLLLRDRLARWLVGLETRFRGSTEFALSLSLFAQDCTTMRLASDDVAVRYYPPGFAIVEQGEQGSSLFLLLLGEAEVVREGPDGCRRVVDRIGPGEYFGEVGLVAAQPRNAHVIAVSGVACLELAAPGPSTYAGRGDGARLPGPGAVLDETLGDALATTVLDVRDHVDAKVAAIAAHRTQFPIQPELFPRDMFLEMFGTEHFVQVLPPRQPETELFGS